MKTSNRFARPSLKQMLRVSLCSFSLLAASLVSAEASDTIEVSFGSLYGGGITTHPTIVNSGTGALGSAMAGNSFYWVCLDNGSENPDVGRPTEPLDPVYTFTVSLDTSILSAGDMWGSSIIDPLTRASVGDAVTNMFFAYRTQLFAGESSPHGGGFTYGSAFQRAVWGLTNTYELGIWSGVVDEDSIAAMRSFFGTYHDDEPLVSAFWDAALISAAGQQQVFFANPNPAQQYIWVPGEEGEEGGYELATIQTIAFFSDAPIPVPEPSSVLLIGGAGLLVLLRHARRK